MTDAPAEAVTSMSVPDLVRHLKGRLINLDHNGANAVRLHARLALIHLNALRSEVEEIALLEPGPNDGRRFAIERRRRELANLESLENGR
jgi:hypothetical protein